MNRIKMHKNRKLNSILFYSQKSVLLIYAEPLFTMYSTPQEGDSNVIKGTINNKRYSLGASLVGELFKREPK